MNTPMKKSSERAVFCTVTLVFYLAHAATAFVAAYLKQIGYTASGAGAVMALLNCVGIAASPVLGNFADRHRLFAPRIYHGNRLRGRFDGAVSSLRHGGAFRDPSFVARTGGVGVLPHPRQQPA